MMVNVEMQISKDVGWGKDRIQMKLKQGATRKGDHKLDPPKGGLYSIIEF